MGTGHFFRCLTLADAMKKCGWQIRFVCRHLPGRLREILDGRGFDLSYIGRDATREERSHSKGLGASQAEDAADTVRALSGGSWEWVIVDHYALDAKWERELRRYTKGIAVIDDLADRPHDCDILLDQNFHTNADKRYSGRVPMGCRLLLGPLYALVREEFRIARQHLEPRDGDVKRVLIFFGDLDAENYTSQAIDAIAGLNVQGVHVDVVVGAGNSRRDEVLARCAQHGFAGHVETNRMAEMMAAADLAIGAGGETTWEQCCLGLPILAIPAAEDENHQIAPAACEGLLFAAERQHDWSRFIRNNAPLLMENRFLRTAMSRAGMRAVDGEGVLRVVRNLTRNNIELRTATVADADRLFTWRNDPAVRAASRIPDIIDRVTHQTWVASSVKNVDRILLIGEREGASVGVVRFDLRGVEAEISIYLVPGPHPPGQGRSLLQCAERWLAVSRPAIERIRARVLAGNERSARLFLGAGYIIEFAEYSKRIGG